MKKLLNVLARDLWVVLLDFFAVNASYYLALLIRFYVNSEFRPTVSYLLGDWAKFAPFYTVLALIIFAAFRLYGGMWRYAGINDMNRIIGANACTTVIMVVGTLLFIRRMPITYYVIGAALQFLCVVIIRFAYRVLLVEKKRFSAKNAAPAMVIGAGEAGRYVISLLNNGVTYHPVCVIDQTVSGRSMDGMPVYGIEQIEEAIRRYNIKCIFIADVGLDSKARDFIREICNKREVTLRDYTNFFSFTGETDAVTGMLSVNESVQDGKRMIPFSPPDIGKDEIGEVVEALRSGWITTGPRTKLLERRLAAYIEIGKADVDTEHEPERWSNRVVCLNSATAAEELNLRILGIRPGDEVIVPAYTYTASASAAIHCGATIKLVDIQKDGDAITHMPEMDYEAMEKAITPKTKAIITVDYGGIVCDYDRVFEIVERKKDLFSPLEADGSPLGDLASRIQRAIGRVAVVADGAHSLGASRFVSHVGNIKLSRPERRYCGAIADFTSFSFHAVKNFTTAEGGASTWLSVEGVSHAEIYKMYQLLSLHGQSKDALAKTKIGAWEYDIIGPWYKCNMTDVMAAIGLRQLDRYLGLLERRVNIMKKYDAICDELGISHMIHHTSDMDSSNHLYPIRIPGIGEAERNAIIEHMARAGVATNVHYKPLPMMTAYGQDCSNYPQAYDYYHNLITLPLHTLLSDEDVAYVCKALKSAVKEVRG